ncbi:MAG: hypothetical protein H6Q21_72 [Bacteroidetes bacterium]|jgi:hypothetical protein|nr:hypothetical protein [Bacteroidota bacterium]
MKIPGCLILFAILLLMMVSSCYYDSEEYLYPNTSSQCDTTDVTYSKSVVPIIQNSCLSCHSNSTAALGGNIKLEDYADVKLRADDHRLLGSIEHQSGYSPMPQGSKKLDDCKISTVRIWVNAGAPNN